ncbi:MAG: ABC transporter permease [Candidatus Aminicenantales bacterium]
MLKNYLKIALRNILRQKGYSFINIAGLTLGLACFILIGLWVRDELSFDRFHEKKDRIFRILNKTENGDLIPSPTYALAPALKEEYPEVEEYSRVWPYAGSLVRYQDKRFEEDRICLADPGFFRMFTFPFLHGNPDTALADRNSIVLTETTSRKYFGDEDPLHKVLFLDQYFSGFVVSAVIKDVPSNSHVQFDLLARVELLGEDRLARWEEWTGPCYVLLRPDVSAADFTSKIADIYKKHEDPEATYVPVLQLLAQVHLHESGRPAGLQKVLLFSLIAVFILVMACVNFMNLSTARSARRAKEVGIRKVVGAHRPQLIRQFLGEAAVLSVISLFLALALVEAFLPRFNLFAGKNLSLLSMASLPMVLLLFLAVLVTGLFAGSYPAFFLSSFPAVETLKKRSGFGGRGAGIRKGLIVFQFAIAIGLITCTLVASRQLHHIQTMDLGLDREHVVILFNNPGLRKSFDSFRNDLLREPSIRSVTSAAQGPTWVGENISINWEGNPSDEMLPVDYTVVDYDFFRTFGMTILSGRAFSREFPADEDGACVINETAAKRMGVEDPLGRTVYMNHPAWPESFRRARVIGVVKDFNARTVHTAIRPFVFRMYKPWHQYVFIKVDGAMIPEALKRIETAFQRRSPDYPFRYLFYDEAFNRQYASERQMGTLFNAFGLLSIFISCLGLFGLVSYTAEQKTKEIGIRKVLGASIPGIISLTTKEFLKWVAVAHLVGWPIAYFVMSQWLRDFAYRVSIGPLVFGLSAGLTLLVAFLTVGYQAVKAALANPVESLRYE